jgi:hypothetical protein
MSEFGRYKVLAVLVSGILLLSACGSSAQESSVISTAVAQTVQAGESLTQIASQPTITPQVTVSLETPAAAVTPTTGATLVSAPADPNCVSAVLVGENPPDGVLLKPGEYYWKTWRLKNTGTCTWNRAYSLIFWNGDLMGGLTSYPLDDDVAPNEEKEISIYLQAPETEGTFTGYWRIQTPWNSNFGVGPSSEPFYVQVEVSNAKKPAYGIASVTYKLVREPETGCPTNVRYTVYATISTSGPVDIDYFWNQSDGNESGVKTLEFKEAGTQVLSREWMIGKGDSPNPRWIEFVVTSPKYEEYGKQTILNNCP